MVDLILIFVLLICIITDLKSKKIFNIVTIPVICFGFLIHSISGGYDGFILSGIGFLVAVGLLLFPFLLGGIDAGDVTLLAAIGSLKGAFFVLNTFLYGAVFSGVISLIIMNRHKEMGGFLIRGFNSIILLKATNGPMTMDKDNDLAPTFPYGVAIATGAAVTYFLGGVV